MPDLFFLAVSLLIVAKSADFAAKYASNLAHALRLPRYVVGFLVVAVISALPETFISVTSALEGVPSFGLGILFGSNVADLTLVFAIIVFSTARGIKVGSKILKENRWYPLLLALPIAVGLDGYYSRGEGALLVAAGLFFYYWIFKENRRDPAPAAPPHPNRHLHLFYFALSIAALLFGANLTVHYGVSFAEAVRVSPVLVGMLVVGLGTTIPELSFSLRALKQNRDDLAVGDILGTVVSDATIVVGILALVNPFSFPQTIVYVTAAFMVVASVVLFAFMRSGRTLTRKEGALLLLYYVVFVITEYAISR